MFPVTIHVLIPCSLPCYGAVVIVTSIQAESLKPLKHTGLIYAVGFLMAEPIIFI